MSLKYANSVVVLIALALASLEPATAQTPSESGSTRPEQHVQVTGSSSTELVNDAVSLNTVIGRREIERFGDAQVADVLRKLPGVLVETLPGKGTQVRLRGLGNGYVRVTINGEPVAQTFGLEALATSQIERIEISRANGVELSGGGVAGTLNLVTKASAGTREQTLQAYAGVANTRSNGGVEAVWGRRDGRVSHTFSGSLQAELIESAYSTRVTARDPDGAFLGEEETAYLQRANSNILNVASGLQVKGGEGWSFRGDVLARHRTIAGRTTEARDHLPGILVPPLLFDQADFRFRGTSWQAKASANRAWSDGDKAEVRVQLSGGDRGVRSSVVGTGNEGVQAMDQSADESMRNRSTTLAGRFTKQFAKGASLAMGGDASHEYFLDSQVLTHRIPFQGLFGTVDDGFDARVSRVALFVQEDEQWSSALNGSVGIRLESLRTRIAGSDGLSADRTSTFVSPLAKLVLSIDEASNELLSASIGQTFKTPGLKELLPRKSIGSINTQLRPEEVGNPELRPETAQTIDLVYERKLSSRGGLSVTVYGKSLQDVILNETILVDGRWMDRKTNAGSAIVAGLEVDARLDVRETLGWEQSGTLSAYVGLVKSRLRDVVSGNKHLDIKAPVMLKMGWQQPIASLGSGTQWGWLMQYAGRSTSRRSDEVERRDAQRFTADAYVTWQPQKGSTWKLSVQNIGGASIGSGQSVVGASMGLTETKVTRSDPSVKLTWKVAIE